jgi:GntR family transcriptional regulator
MTRYGGRYMKKIDKKSRVPLYYQLVDLIVEDIEAGILKENDKLLSERELCDLYDISRSTVRQAMIELEKGGYIYKEHGKGTFVAEKKLKQDLQKFYSFTEEMKKLGKKPSSKVLAFEVVEAEDKIARRLELCEGDEVYVIKRLRLADLKPMMLEISYVPCDRFPNMTREDLESNAMYEIFKSRYGAKLSRAEEIFSAVLVRKSEARTLDVSEGTPGMRIERYAYEGSKKIEYTKSIARGDSFKFRVVLD